MVIGIMYTIRCKQNLTFKKRIMKKLLVAGLLFFTVSCGSEENTNNSSDSANMTIKKGNTTGSNMVEMDTVRTDTANRTTNPAQ